MKTTTLKQHAYSFCLIVAAASILSVTSHAFSTWRSDNENTTFKLGQLVAPRVSGVEYRCGEHQGVTDALGRFECGDEKRVTFYINGESIGSTDVQKTVTPVDLVKPLDRRYHVITEMNHRRDGATKVFEQLMQNDFDRKMENGIQIKSTGSNSQYASKKQNTVTRQQEPLI